MTQLPDSAPTDGGRHPSIVERIATSTTPRVPFSVEFYPPRDEAAEDRLWRAATVFSDLGAAFVSVTYGAGGSTRDRTVRVVERLVRETNLLPIAHLTAVDHTVAELSDMIRMYGEVGVSNILALRGDPPGDPLGEWTAHPEGLHYAEELVRLIHEVGDFHVGVASFPEGHYRARDLEHDSEILVNKLRAGAEYSITQMFWDVEHYLRLRDRAVRADQEQGAKPIIPGLMPVTSLRQVTRMVELSGCALPDDLSERLQTAAGDGPEENRAAVREVGIELTTRMCERLIAEGAPCLHFNTLNFSKATHEVLSNLSMVPASGVAAGRI
ncbi:methylenetetrahydrofolate reductase [NAD(P)H] [Dietzia sp. B32]|uniref:methylenetetrahydrofolate reductase [NAD(P)H] n=1 Tax=Dietzia sp. B32 TaxID=2915130 RepID=UPI0021ADBE26|nr:methylenetetrahydrofolate reductase [NAD(P)H] [Dietzia sp. B32]UVE95014.1 methylenetetrahydrofolate reductase [NAD(P)H] [Dietzia sp. B32]